MITLTHLGLLARSRIVSTAEVTAPAVPRTVLVEWLADSTRVSETVYDDTQPVRGQLHSQIREQACLPWSVLDRAQVVVAACVPVLMCAMQALLLPVSELGEFLFPVVLAGLFVSLMVALAIVATLLDNRHTRLEALIDDTYMQARKEMEQAPVTDPREIRTAVVRYALAILDSAPDRLDALHRPPAVVAQADEFHDTATAMVPALIAAERADGPLDSSHPMVSELVDMAALVTSQSDEARYQLLAAAPDPQMASVSDAVLVAPVLAELPTAGLLWRLTQRHSGGDSLDRVPVNHGRRWTDRLPERASVHR